MRRRWLAALLMLVGLLCGTSAQAELKLMAAADLHYIDPSLFEGSDLLMESALYGDGKTPHHSAAWLEALVLETIANKPDALLLLGDQSFNGEVLSHRAVSDAMARVEAAGIAVYAIPGNHDINNDRAVAFLAGGGTEAIHSIPSTRYEKYYGMYGPHEAISRDAASFSYMLALDDTYWLLMLDAGIYEPFAEAFGLITAETEAWMGEVLALADAQGKRVVSVSHQSLLPHSSIVTGGTMIINGDGICDLLTAHGVRLHLSGHLHVQHIAHRDGLADASLSSLSNYPNQYAMITLRDDGGYAYETWPLSPAHLPEGLTDESRAFFLAASEKKALMSLRDVDAPEDIKQQMAEYAAWMNMHYYGGTSATVAAEAAADPRYEHWKTLAPDAFWTNYLADMLAVPADMTVLITP